MKESLINRQRTAVTHVQPPEIAKPSNGAIQGLAPQRPALLLRGLPSILSTGSDQLNASLRQSLAQRVTIPTAVRNDTNGLLSGDGPLGAALPKSPTALLWPAGLPGGSRLNVVSQRNTRAVGHHRPLFPPSPLVFPPSRAIFVLEQNCLPETPRSTLNATAHSTRLETPAGFSTRPPAAPNPAATSTLPVTETLGEILSVISTTQELQNTFQQFAVDCRAPSATGTSVSRRARAISFPIGSHPTTDCIAPSVLLLAMPTSINPFEFEITAATSHG